MRRTVLVLLLALSTACGSPPQEAPDSSGPAPTSTTAPPTSTTVTTAPPAPTTTVYAPDTVEGQVEAAYLAAWEAYTEAMREVDADLLGSHYADKALDYRLADLADLERQGLAGRVEVEHNYNIQQIGWPYAAVVDTYVNHMRLIDPETGAFAEPDPNVVVGSAFTLELRDSQWVITDINSLE